MREQGGGNIEREKEGRKEGDIGTMRKRWGEGVW